MGFSFGVDGRTLWSPSNGVGDLFLRTGAAVAPLAGLPTGMTRRRDGDVDVDLDAFAGLVDALTATYVSSNHPVLRSLLEGFLGTAIVMVERAGRPVPALVEPAGLRPRDVQVRADGLGAQGDPAHLRGVADELDRSMPR